jgi:colanic acid/amylovoran biosynthesis glycosyltransferase
MARPLAVFTTEMGASFINRHIADVAPGGAAVVSGLSGLKPTHIWNDDAPVLYLDRSRGTLAARLSRRLSGRDQRIVETAIAGFLRRHGVQVVLGEFLDFFIDFVPLLNRLGIPYVVQGHGVDVSAALRDPAMAERYKLYASARAVLTRSELHRRRLIELGLPASLVHVNIGGIDVPARAPVRGPAAAKRLLAVSYMVPKKGPFYLLEAFRQAATRDPELTLDIVGGGPLLPAIRQAVDAAGLAGVRLHGVVCDEVRDRLLAECGVFVQHSITDPETGNEEGLPASIQEAMAHGLAIVSTRHAGIPEAIEQGVSGLLVEEGDVVGMAHAILEVVENASAMGAASYAKAEREYPWRLERSRLRDALGLEPVEA